MEEKKINITPEFIIDLALRRRWVILLPLTISLSVGIILAIVSPRIYEATTLILVEGQRVSQNYVQAIVTEETNEQINTITRQILSRTSLEKIIDKFSLFDSPKNANMYHEHKIENLRSNISVDVITDRRRTQTDAFEISYKGTDPQKVMLVVNGLAKLFIDENVRARELQAVGTSAFLKSELETMRVQLEGVEEQIKRYRKRYMGELPEQLETNLRILERLQDNLSDQQQSLRDAKIRLANLKAQTSRREPSIVVIGGDQTVQEVPASLDELVAELETLQGRYTDAHPDIIRLRRQIEDFKSNTSLRNGSGTSSIVPPEIRRQISEVQREIDLAQSEIKNTEEQFALYEERVENTPKREQELLTLRRGYQNIQTSYDSLLGRKLEADIAVNMEVKQKGAQFRIIDSAIEPELPIQPNLRQLFLMAVAAGLAVGCGTAFLLEYTNTAFRKPDEIESAFDIKVLTVIPTILNPKQVFLKRLSLVGLITCALVTIGLFAVLGAVTIKGI